MASFLLSECLEEIFSNLTEYPSSDININITVKDLYSCTLVSRHWCRISTPLLYAYPFHHFRRNFSHIRYYKLIRTLLGCIPQFEIKQTYKQALQIPYNIKNYKKKSNSKNISSTFNYISFIRGLIFHKMMFKSIVEDNNKEIWLSAYNPKRISEVSTIAIMDYLIKFICKNCNNLTTLEFSFAIRNDDCIINLLTVKDYNGKSKLSDLKELYYSSQINFYSRDDKNNSREIFYPLNNVFNLNLLYVNKDGLNAENINLLSKFISLQKNLQHFVLTGFEKVENGQNEVLARFFINLLSGDKNNKYYNTIINSLSTQYESLQILEFKNLEFNLINGEVLDSLRLLKNIKKLKLYRCKMIDNLHSWVKDLKKLEIFEIMIIDLKLSELFIIQLVQLIQSFSNNLIKLVINDKQMNDFTLLYQQIPLYLHSLTHLELPKILPSELISIFLSCTKLVYLSVMLLNDKLSEEILKNLGKFVPKTLKRIQFKNLLESNNSTISFELLRFFLEEYANNGGALKYLEIEGLGNHIIVTEQFGVQIIEYF
ncbi:hypothetical protein C1645_876368 [Glomus cerebriforme]|uniref:Uncharacterized protein n=1 Tax=Glomus cerebriforme TaxID=658196 RepID=A0A397T4R6_9GLOM|nr:hypothetical protein C1645_876368 [Glomus cerebriforme]